MKQSEIHIILYGNSEEFSEKKNFWSLVKKSKIERDFNNFIK